MAITQVPGITVGHWTDLDAATGCTVVLCGSGAVAGVDVRGAAPATRETEVLRPGSLVGRAHAILLSGGSAFGLDAATGVMRFLEERGIGFTTGHGPVPIVPAAALYDLSIGRADVRPDAAAGYAACLAAGTSVAEGCVGAGTGATVAKIGGPQSALKGGIGTAAVTLPDGNVVAALLAVNAVGGVYDPATGEPVAAPKSLVHGVRPFAAANTTIGVIATTAPLDAGSVNRLATVAHDGLALAIRPAHTQYDGDTLFALSLPTPGAATVDPLQLGQAAVEVVVAAVLRAVRAATPVHGVPAATRVTPAEHEVLRQVEQLTPELIELTRALVRIPTVNPPGECYTECAELLQRTLLDFGYQVEVLLAEGMPEHTERYPRPNVIGSLGEGGPVLHFNGHYDVVPPESGWTMDPFGAEVCDGRIYGRGTCDQKAGLAASIFAVEAIRRAGIQLTGTIEQSATVDEESGGFAGVGWLCDQGRIARDRQRYVVITEPLDPERVCIGHRGVYWFEVTTLGRVGHGSMPGLAVNAAEEMARLIRAIDTDLRPRLASRTSHAPVEPPEAKWPSINLNALHAGQALGGWQTPCVPDRCTAVFDRRFIHEETFDEVRAEIVALLDGQGIEYELRDVMRVDPLLGSTDGTLAQATARAIQDALGVQSRFIASPGTYDQKHVVRRAGIDECIAYGPGRLVLAHQPDEYVAIDDLVASTGVMALLALRLLS